MGYWKHLKINLKVSVHALNDFVQHLIHGLIPFIKWKHYHETDKEE